MHRDKDVIYHILKWSEENATGRARKVDLNINPDTLHYHIGLCKEAGFLRAQKLVDYDSDQYEIINLTWAGHNALDKLKEGCELRTICG